jgi:branched-chain amino acid transport system substrate-binding protein
MINALKQAVHPASTPSPAGGQQEPSRRGPPPRGGSAPGVRVVLKPPGVPHVAEFVDAVKKKTGRVPTARTWFGFA